MRRTVVDPRFRAVLVTLIVESGISQNRVAAEAHVSHGYLSQIINGTRNPSRQVAQALDEVLGADGQLVALIAYGANPDDRDQLAAAVINPRQASRTTIDSLARVLAGQRNLDDVMGSAALIDSVMATVGTVATMTREVVGPNRRDLMMVAGQWAQFAGWLHTSTGRWDGARMWFARGLEWAMEVGDPDLTATIVSYQSHVAWLNCQWAPAVGLAEAAMRDERVYPGQRAYDAYAAARGHAAMNDLAGAKRLLGVADAFAAECEAWAGEVPAWQYYRAPWVWQVERGLALLYMARWDPRHATPAVLELRSGIAAIPEEMQGADWTAEYLTHLANAYIHADVPDVAREVLDRAKFIAEATGSTRVLRLVADRERRLRAFR
jgi:transcriptional regulator with XRE-family HTH domain